MQRFLGVLLSSEDVSSAFEADLQSHERAELGPTAMGAAGLSDS